MLELRSEKDLEVAKTCFANGEPFGKVCDRLGIKLGRELNMTDDAWRFTPTSEILLDGKDPRDPDVAKKLLELGYLMLHEGKTFHQYTDKWEYRPRYIVSIKNILDKSTWLKNTSFFRLAYRTIAASTNERTGIFNIHPPGIITGDKSPTEQEPSLREDFKALYLVGTANTFVFDFCLRLYVSSSTVNYFYLARATLPRNCSQLFIIHSALRLTCNHTGYEPLWREQLGETWRDRQPPFTFPVLSTEDDRWLVRAAIDAVVADAYGLNREQYAHILSTFSHKSYPKAPQLCLACFDELQTIGLEAFTKKYDPYWDIPLNENLPKPVIDLPIPNQSNENAVSTEDGSFQLTAPPKEKTKRKRKQ